MITVTTPRGTICQRAGNFTGLALPADPEKATAEHSRDAAARTTPAAGTSARPAAPAPAPPSRLSATSTVPPVTPAVAAALPQATPAPIPNPHNVVPAPNHVTHNVVNGVPVLRPPHELAVVKAKALAQGLPDPTATVGASAAATEAARGGDGQIEIEFNHAITYVNKIKSRYKDKPDTYKQFLEILQTYQRDGRAITEVSPPPLCMSFCADIQVYEQVSALFASAPDLIGEFKQFLPDDSRDSALFNSLMIADRGYAQSNANPKRAGAAKESTRKKRGAPGDAKPSKVSHFSDPISRADSSAKQDCSKGRKSSCRRRECDLVKHASNIGLARGCIAL